MSSHHMLFQGPNEDESRRNLGTNLNRRSSIGMALLSAGNNPQGNKRRLISPDPAQIRFRSEMREAQQLRSLAQAGTPMNMPNENPI